MKGKTVFKFMSNKQSGGKNPAESMGDPYENFASDVHHFMAQFSFKGSPFYDLKSMSPAEAAQVGWGKITRHKIADVGFSPPLEAREAMEEAFREAFPDWTDRDSERFRDRDFSNSVLLSALTHLVPHLPEVLYAKLQDRGIDCQSLKEGMSTDIFLGRDLLSIPEISALLGHPEFGASHDSFEDRVSYLQNITLDALYAYPSTKGWMETSESLLDDVYKMGNGSLSSQGRTILFSAIRDNPSVWDSIGPALDFSKKWFPEFGNRPNVDTTKGSTRMVFDVLCTARALEDPSGLEDIWKDLRPFNNLEKSARDSLGLEFAHQLLFSEVSWTRLNEALSSSEPVTLDKAQVDKIVRVQKKIFRGLLVEEGDFSDEFRGFTHSSPKNALASLGKLALQPTNWRQFVGEGPLSIKEFCSEKGLISCAEGFSLPENSKAPIIFSEDDKGNIGRLVNFERVLSHNSSSLPSYLVQTLGDLYRAQENMKDIGGKYDIRDILENLPFEIEENSGLSYFSGLMATAAQQTEFLDVSKTRVIDTYSPPVLAGFLLSTLASIHNDVPVDLNDILGEIQKSEDLGMLMLVLSDSELFTRPLDKADYLSLDELCDESLRSEYRENPIFYRSEERDCLQDLMDTPGGLAFLDVSSEPSIPRVIKAGAFYDMHPEARSGTDYDWGKGCMDRLSDRVGTMGSVSIICKDKTHLVLNETLLSENDYHDIHRMITGVRLEDELPPRDLDYKWFEPDAWTNGYERFTQFEARMQKIVAPGFDLQELPDFLKVLSRMRPDMAGVFEDASKMAKSLFVEYEPVSVDWSSLALNQKILREEAIAGPAEMDLSEDPIAVSV
jgi:hypothetical protein